MDFFAVILFLVVFFIRPQEWIGPIFMFPLVNLNVALAVVSMFLRNHSLRLRDFFRTPHDWGVCLFFGWIVIQNDDRFGSFMAILPLLVFYIVIVQALSTPRRIRLYLESWTILMFIIALLAVASEYGFDPANGYNKTHSHLFQGRLIFNNSMYENPNALAHSLAPVLGMVYLLFMWKRPIFIKEIALLLYPVMLYCIFLTESKGGFLVCFVTFIVTFAFGRRRAVQVGILILSFTMGLGVVQNLPRMDELQRGPQSREEGIAGRLMVWQFARDQYDSGNRLGYLNFQNGFSQEHGFPKASHGAYVQVGAELGYPGLLLYILLLYLAVQTLVRFKSENDDEDERLRRTLMVLLVAFACSGWMVDFAYRPNLFMIMAAVAAYQRMLLKRVDPVLKPKSPHDLQAVPSPGPGVENATAPDAAALPEAEPAAAAAALPAAEWLGMNRFTWKDGLRLLVLVAMTEWLWTFFMSRV